MINIYKISSTAALFLLTSLSTAYVWGMPCNGDLVTVSGNVRTINTSPIEQQGEITMSITPFQGGMTTFFRGSIHGVIQRQTGVRTLLNHQIEFSSGEQLLTKNDLAISKLPPIGVEADGTACAFEVVESISKFSGTGQFEKATGHIIAEGTLSFCSLNNQDSFNNSFNLSGLLCLQN